jgi:hypothetical protein
MDTRTQGCRESNSLPDGKLSVHGEFKKQGFQEWNNFLVALDCPIGIMAWIHLTFMPKTIVSK